jgi:FMN phosphatase YigB (HAD superfamily)
VTPSAVLFDFGYTLFGHARGAEVVEVEAGRLGVVLTPSDALALWDEIESAAGDTQELALGRDLDDRVWRERWHVLYARADRVAPGLGAALEHSFHDPHAWIPYSDVHRTLTSLAAAGVPVGIASNTGWDIRDVFRVHGLMALVRSFTLSYECGAVKPSRAFFHAACADLGVMPIDTLMVGDDPTTDGRALDAGLGDVVLLDPLTPLGEEHGLDVVAARVLR